MPRNNGWTASTWVGKPVRNSAGETLGKIEELIMDPSSGNITFGIVSFAGVLGMENKVLAIPWNALGVMPGRDYVVLDMDRSVLERAPYFEGTLMPDFGDAAARARIYKHYGYPDPAAMRDRAIVVHREYPAPRKEVSFVTAVFLVLVLLGLAGLTYMVSTRGWQQSKQEIMNSAQGVTYAMKETSGDAALTAKVKTALTLNKRISAASINVDSADGIVTLRGEVGDDQTRATAGMIAQDTPGVREVRNHLFVMSPGK